MIRISRGLRGCICFMLAVSLLFSPFVMSAVTFAEESAEMSLAEFHAAFNAWDEEMEALTAAEYLLEAEREYDLWEGVMPQNYTPKEATKFPSRESAMSVMAFGDDFSTFGFSVANFSYGSNADGYIEISSAEMLDGIRDLEDWQELDYILTADIDLLELSFSWLPFAEEFVGEFNGNGYKIQNLYIDEDGLVGVGLFSQIGEGGLVYDLTITNVNIDVDADNVGALAGINKGTIERVVVDGDVVKGNNNVGSLVGVNEGTIDFSYIYCEVTGKTSVGGFVGVNNGTITNSGVAEAAVYANNGSLTDIAQAGGFVGWHKAGLIKDCVAFADPVVGASMTGGFVGRADSGSSIITSYAMARIMGITHNITNANRYSANGRINHRGGFVGFDNEGTYEDCYYEMSMLARETGYVAGYHVADYYASGTYVGYQYYGSRIQSDTAVVSSSPAYVINPAGITGIGGQIFLILPPPNGSSNPNIFAGTGRSGPDGYLASHEEESYAGLFNNSDAWVLPKTVINGITEDLVEYSYEYKLYPMVKGLNFRGTPENPILIGSADELQNIPESTTHYYQLTNDIDLYYSSWIRLNNFYGYLDGNGKTITMNFVQGEINGWDRNASVIPDILDSSGIEDLCARLFFRMDGAYVGDLTLVGMPLGGQVHNSFFENIIVKDVDVRRGTFGGGMFMKLSNSVAVNCHVENLTIHEITNSTLQGVHGGFAGSIERSKVYDCTVRNFTAIAPGSATIGGFTGGISNEIPSHAYEEAFIMENSYDLHISNCHVYDSELLGGIVFPDVGSTWSYAVGGFIGGSTSAKMTGINGSKIENCTTNANVTNISSATLSGNGPNAGVSAGGFIGGSPAGQGLLFINCGATGNVLGPHGVGGFAGSVRLATFQNCYATGDATATSFYNYTAWSCAGGFVGFGIAYFENCFATGDVTGRRIVGGFGGSLGSTQSHVKHFGAVTNRFDISGNTTGCYATGDVYATDNSGDSIAGGFAGNTYFIIADSYSTGNVYGNRAVGGFVGLATATIIDCYSTGKPVAMETGGAGGFAGAVLRDTEFAVFFLNCIYDMEKSGNDKGIGFIPANFYTNSNHVYAYPVMQPPVEVRGLTTAEMQDKDKIMETKDTFSYAMMTGSASGLGVYLYYDNATFPWAFEAHEREFGAATEPPAVLNGTITRFTVSTPSAAIYDGRQFWAIHPDGESPVVVNHSNSPLMKQLLQLTASSSSIALGATATITLENYVGKESGDVISWTVDGGARLVSTTANSVTIEGVDDDIARVNVYINGVKQDNVKLVVGTGGDVGLKATFLSPAPRTITSTHDVGVNSVFIVMFNEPIDKTAFSKMVSPATLTAHEGLGMGSALRYSIAQNDFMLVITLARPLSYGALYTLTLSENIKGVSGASLGRGATIDFRTQSFAKPDVVVEKGQKVVGGTEYTVTATYKNEIPYNYYVTEEAEVRFVVRGGIGARETHGGEMIFYEKAELALLPDITDSVSTTFVVSDEIGDFYVDVYTWSPDGHYSAADTVNIVYEVK